MNFSFRSTPLKRFSRFILLLVGVAGIIIAVAQPSSAQFPLPEGFSPGNIIGPPPVVTRYGNIETMSVRSPLSNRNLFTIASPTVYDRSPDAQSDQLPVEQRAKEIQAKLLLLLKRDMDPETLMFGVAQLNNVTVISWSRVAFSIDVAYQTDPHQALGVLRDLSNKFYNDIEWHDKMVAEPEVLGIDSVTHSGMTITIWIQTQPAQQWAVGREFRLRVREALEEHGIEIGVPRQTYQFESSSIGDYSSEPAKKGL